MFLCEAVANQLQQLKGCCGVSQVLGFVQKSYVLWSMQRVSHKLEVCASKERMLLQDQVQLRIGAKVQL